jgi:hypothetical protein
MTYPDPGGSSSASGAAITREVETFGPLLDQTPTARCSRKAQVLFKAFEGKSFSHKAITTRSAGSAYRGYILKRSYADPAPSACRSNAGSRSERIGAPSISW